jgi:diadenosine tetraphosphate (Ap4A) HIT family hydrolase
VRDFIIDPRLQTDSCLLGQLQLSQIRLMDNALFPWLILVPCVTQFEIHQLDRKQQIQLLDEITTISHFIENHFSIDKINVGAIGNIVRQLHVHIVGRREGDHCWPNVVWGVKENKSYTQLQVGVIADKLDNYLSQHTKLDYTVENRGYHIA